MYGCLLSCGSSDVIEAAITDKNSVKGCEKPKDKANTVFDPVLIRESDVKVVSATNELVVKRNNLIRMFRDTNILDVYYGGSSVWSPYKEHDNVKDMAKINRLYELLVNKSMWLLVFDKLCAGFLISETVLRRIDYFNEFIENNMIMDKTEDELNNYTSNSLDDTKIVENSLIQNSVIRVTPPPENQVVEN